VREWLEKGYRDALGDFDRSAPRTLPCAHRSREALGRQALLRIVEVDGGRSMSVSSLGCRYISHWRAGAAEHTVEAYEHRLSVRFYDIHHQRSGVVGIGTRPAAQ
jgi:hypothetical protein